MLSAKPAQLSGLIFLFLFVRIAAQRFEAAQTLRIKFQDKHFVSFTSPASTPDSHPYGKYLLVPKHNMFLLIFLFSAEIINQQIPLFQGIHVKISTQLPQSFLMGFCAVPAFEFQHSVCFGV